MPTNYRQIKAIEAKNKEKMLSVNPKLNEQSGIYFLIRKDEQGFKYCYIGQAKHILTRLAQHLSGYQHIDLSIKKHGLYSEENPYGWQVNFLPFSLDELDEKEQEYIKRYANAGFQMKNKTSGSQGKGKKQIADYREPRGYRAGVEQGRKKASKEIAGYFDKYLEAVIKKPCKYADSALQKFQEFLDFYKGGDE
jgi:hypothetical protein